MNAEFILRPKTKRTTFLFYKRGKKIKLKLKQTIAKINSLILPLFHQALSHWDGAL